MPMRQAGGRRSDEFEPFGARYIGTNQHRFACGVHTMHSKDVFGEINSDGDNGGHDPPLPQNE